MPDIPLHASPLMNGNDEYRGLDIQSRKRLLSSFFTMLQHLPVGYEAFAYRKSECPGGESIAPRLKRDIVNQFFENLGYFQAFDKVKVYYDDGQPVVTKALHDTAEYALSAEAVVYRHGSPGDYRLSQAADLICTFELTALKFEAGEQTRTDERFFGMKGAFRKNWLKKVRRKLLQGG